MKFSFEETRDIIALAPVAVSMRNVLDNRLVQPEPGRLWPYAGKEYPIGPFRLFRAVVELAVIMAVAATVGKERERLLIALRMEGADAVEPVAKAVSEACEEYAVTMQHGASGWSSYQDFIKPNEASNG